MEALHIALAHIKELTADCDSLTTGAWQTKAEFNDLADFMLVLRIEARTRDEELSVTLCTAQPLNILALLAGLIKQHRFRPVNLWTIFLSFDRLYKG